jgi:hypothetical protein
MPGLSVVTSGNRRSGGAGKGALAALVGAAVLVGAVGYAVQERTGINILGRTDQGAAVLRHALGADPQQVGLARADLPLLTVADRGPLTGYRRVTAQWGPTWADVDHNGCHTRDDILRRDLTRITLTGRCTVVAGTLADPYTGKTIQFAKRTATAVQIDQIVPLAEAWRTGARDWTVQRREQLANDPAELLAVDGPANESKGDSGPDEWQPQPAERCDYAVRYVLVKHKYGLTITVVEKRALDAALTTCE